MTSEVPVTIVLSVFVPLSAVQTVKNEIFNAGGFRDLAVDDRQLNLTMGFAVVQAYYHFRADDGDKLTKKIEDERSRLHQIRITVREKVNTGEFAGFAEYWLCPSGSLTGEYLGIPLQDMPTETAMQASLDGGCHARVLFVSRPRVTAPIPTAVTIIEVPEVTQEKLALGLAYHPEKAFDSPLCILDMLSAKACWLERNITQPDLTAGTEDTHFLEERLNQALQATKRHLEQAFGSPATSETSLTLTRSISETTVLVAVLKMNAAMLAVVGSQLRFVGQSLSGYGLRPEQNGVNTLPFPILDALRIVKNTKRLERKYQPLFEGIVACISAADKYNKAVALENSSRQERVIAQHFNLLTLILAAGGIGISATAMIDNEIAQGLIFAYSPGNETNMLLVFFVKLVSCVATTVLAIVSVSLFYMLLQYSVRKLRRSTTIE